MKHFSHYEGMGHFYTCLERHLKQLGISFYELEKIADISDAYFTFWKNNERMPTNRVIKKLASFPQLHLTEDTLKGWRAADEYTLKQLQIAVEVLEQEAP